MKVLKSNSRTKIDFGKGYETTEVKLPKFLSDNDLFLFNLSMLDRFDPEKILYSIKEASRMLNLSEDFVGNRIRSGKIKATRLGDRPMINKLTLAQIMTEGV